MIQVCFSAFNTLFLLIYEHPRALTSIMMYHGFPVLLVRNLTSEC